MMMSKAGPNARLEFVVTNTLIARDIRRSVTFRRDVLGASVLHEGEGRPTLFRLGSILLTINVSGGPTDDKPEALAAPPPDARPGWIPD